MYKPGFFLYGKTDKVLKRDGKVLLMLDKRSPLKNTLRPPRPISAYRPRTECSCRFKYFFPPIAMSIRIQSMIKWCSIDEASCQGRISKQSQCRIWVGAEQFQCTSVTSESRAHTTAVPHWWLLLSRQLESPRNQSGCLKDRPQPPSVSGRM